MKSFFQLSEQARRQKVLNELVASGAAGVTNIGGAAGTGAATATGTTATGGTPTTGGKPATATPQNTTMTASQILSGMLTDFNGFVSKHNTAIRTLQDQNLMDRTLLAKFLDFKKDLQLTIKNAVKQEDADKAAAAKPIVQKPNVPANQMAAPASQPAIATATPPATTGGT